MNIAAVSRKWLIYLGSILGLILLILIVLLAYLLRLGSTLTPRDLAIHVIKTVPLIDGHNDLAWDVRELAKNKLLTVDLRKNLTLDLVWGKEVCRACSTDIPRLRAGHVGAQFWVAYTPCESQYKDAVGQTLQQIDVIRRMIHQYSDHLQYVSSPQGIEEAFSKGKIGSLIAVEGGHSIDSKLAILRMYYDLGVRYMTLTHSCSTPWASASPEDGNGTLTLVGLSNFGKAVVHEMNRLGMMVDISHVSKQTQIDVLTVSRAPVIYSHSNAFTLCNHHRNVHDDVLRLLTRNGGIIMVNFFNSFVTCTPNATIHNVVAMLFLLLHIQYIRKLIGVEYLGLGGDYDGVEEFPEGLEDVSKYPDLLALLADDPDQPWSENDLQKLAGLNVIRVFREVEQVRDELITELPNEDFIPSTDIKPITKQCVTW